ncbi:trinucleotide repeat-containing gene 6A protein-like [Scleropages formosus]|uniref:trinucleotide repeat-containing gene 6A protein-like n=1 Tax=Scleropages formosus TaxID=113540 RepID=UPI0010FA95C0|nr:trinucleotide repeat-containing gene 6A protein-like [Scleropages formosus]
MAPIRDSVSHSPNQTDLSHGSLGAQYENPSWSTGSPGSDSDIPWCDVVLHGCERESWPVIRDGNLELTSECVDGDSASSTGSERNLHGTASGSCSGGDDSGISVQSHGPSTCFGLAGGSDPTGSGSLRGPWGVSLSPAGSTCEGSSESDLGTQANEGHSKALPWGSTGSSANRDMNPSTSAPNTSLSTWSATQSSGPLGNSNVAWNTLQDDNTEPAANGTSGKPLNLNTETNGPNTTNVITSSLPNSTSSAQTSEPSTWHVSSASSCVGEGGSGAAWGEKSATPPEDHSAADTVNTSLTQAGLSAPASCRSSDNANRGWESGPKSSPSLSWSAGSAATQHPWGSVSSSSSTSVTSHAGGRSSNSEWTSLPSAGLCEGDNGTGKQTSAWRSLEDDALGRGGAASHSSSSASTWPRPVEASEGSSESSVGSRTERDTHRSIRKKGSSPSGLVQSMLSRGDIDPRVLSNTGWGQTPIRQDNAWDLAALQTRTKPEISTGAKGTKGSSAQDSWGDALTASGSVKNGQAVGSNKGDCSWSNGQKSKQGWVPPAGGEEWAGVGHWVEPQKPGSGSWESDSDRSGSGWSEAGHGSTGSTWDGSSEGRAPSRSDGVSVWSDATKFDNGQHKGGVENGNPKQSTQCWGEDTASCSSAEWCRMQDSSGVQSKASGWLGGPMPSPPRENEPTGWEEPSPESIRRKMEIDDGTSAWGDPSKYNSGNVNMWNASSGLNTALPKAQPQHTAPAAEIAPPPCSLSSKAKSSSSSWGEPYETAQKCESSWVVPVTIDNGTSAWGKPVDTGASWEEPASCGWAGPKPAQDTWGGEGLPAPGAHPPSWEPEEEVEIGMWSNNTSAEMSQTGSWSGTKKAGPKYNKGTNKPDDTWMNQFSKQFNDINFTREPSEEAMRSNRMEIAGGVLADKHMDVEKHGQSLEYNGMMRKGVGTRQQMAKDDRSPYFDKNMSPVFGGGNTALPGRASQQLPSQPNLRSQVPPLLPSQVPASLLKYPPASGGLGPLLAPQQMAMLSQLSQLSQLNQLNQLSQLQRLLLQQQKIQQQQRNMTVGSRQQPDLQGRSVGSNVQPLTAPSRHLDPPQPKRQSSPLPPSALASYMETLVPQAGSEPSREQHTLGAFSSFPLGSYPIHSGLRQAEALLQQAVKPPTPMLTSDGHSLLNNGLACPESPIQPRTRRPLTTLDTTTASARGLSSSLNVNNLDINFKEPQSRLKKWTALDMSVSSPLDPTPGKPGALSSGLRLEDPAFISYDFRNGSSSPVSPPGSVGDSWSTRAKSPHGISQASWPPEFRPGEPWKGYPNIDPETDPYVTPGSVMNILSINTVRDVEHLRDRNNGSTSSLNTTLPSTSAWSSIRAYSSSLSSTAQSISARSGDSKSAWSSGAGANSSLAHELWKVPLPSRSVSTPSRPPPGLTGQKQPAPWDDGPLRLGTWGGSDSRFTPGSNWSDSNSGRAATNWLVLKNLTPQIDGSTLRTLCMQHGPLMTFHLNLPHGNAVVCYSSKEEAAKAQTSLHMCVLGNTTILAEVAGEEEVSRFFAQGQSSVTTSPGWQALGVPPGRGSSMDGSHPYPGHWSGAGDLQASPLWGAPNYSTSLWGNPGGGESRGMASSSPLASFLPDHLTGGGDGM